MLIHAPWPRPGGQPCRGLIQARLGIQHVQAADSEGAREQGEEENMTGDASAATCVLRFIYLDSIARLGTVATQRNAFCVFPSHRRQRWRFLI